VARKPASGAIARPFAFLGVLLAAACVALPPATPLDAQSLPLEIRSHSMPFRIDDPQAQRIGRLIWRGGLMMTANSTHFGGWSDLYVTPDGRRLTSITDVGGWFTTTMDYDKDGDLVGLHDARIGPLHGLDGKPLATKEWKVWRTCRTAHGWCRSNSITGSGTTRRSMAPPSPSTCPRTFAASLPMAVSRRLPR
jgi:YD repeat-containing protein